MCETELLTTTHKKDLQMKSILMLVIIGLATTQAQAIGSLNLDFRADMLSQTYNDAAELAGAGADNYRFFVNTARLDYKGTLNDDVTYRLRARFAARSPSNMNISDNTNNTVDFAYATHKMSDMLKLTVGKFGLDVGAYEGATAGPDLYFTSEAYGGTAAYSAPTATATTSRGYANQLYGTGVKLGMTFGTHEVNLMANNLDLNAGRANLASNAVTGSSGQNKNMVGLSYKSTMMDKALGLMASYHTQTKAEDFKNDWAAVGIQWNMNPVLAQLDYAMNTSTYTTGTVFKDQVSSIVGKVVYSVDESLAVGVKATSSEEKLDQAAPIKNKFMSYGLQAEYKPVAADMYRYHVAVNSRTMTPETGDARNIQELIVGMKINADFLK